MFIVFGVSLKLLRNGLLLVVGWLVEERYYSCFGEIKYFKWCNKGCFLVIYKIDYKWKGFFYFYY